MTNEGVSHGDYVSSQVKGGPQGATAHLSCMQTMVDYLYIADGVSGAVRCPKACSMNHADWLE